MCLYRPKFILIATMFLIQALGVAQVGYASGSISAAELNNRLTQNEAPIILDVRTPEEFAQGHVPGAVNIPVTDITDRSSELKPYQEKEIVVYCAAGPRAAFARSVMSQLGFNDVTDLEGHMQQWVAGGYPVETPQ